MAELADALASGRKTANLASTVPSLQPTENACGILGHQGKAFAIVGGHWARNGRSARPPSAECCTGKRRALAKRLTRESQHFYEFDGDRTDCYATVSSPSHVGAISCD